MPYCARCRKLIGPGARFCPTCVENMLKGDSSVFAASTEEECFSELIANLDNLKTNEKAFAQILDVDAKEYANQPIEEYLLSVRAIKRLNQIGVETQEQLLMISPSTLMGLDYFGKGSLILVLKYLSKIVGSAKMNQEEQSEDIAPIMLSDEQKQFLIANCDRLSKNEFDALKEENQGSKELLQVIRSFEKQNWVDYELLCSCLKDPERARRLNDTLVYMRAAFENQQILQAAFDRLPAYKASNIARYYLLAYNGSLEEKTILGKVYSDPDCTLDSILKNPPESKKHTDIVLRFVKWCNFDVAGDLAAFMNELYKNDRARDVLRCRAAKMTLAEIGECYDVTRERIRQIELKSVTRFGKFQLSYRLISKICADRNGDTVLTPAEISYYCGEYTEEVLYLLKCCTASDYRYSPSMDVFLVNSDGSEEGRIMSYVENLPDAFSEEGLQGILRDAFVQEGLLEELVEQYIKQTYTLQDDRYVRAKLRRNDMYKHVLTKYYPNGIRVYDPDLLQDFKKNVCREFGVDSDISDRALAARLGDLGILCNRGTYKSKQDHYLSDELAKDLESFVETNKSPVMPISYVYRVFRERLKAENVDNVYYFLGILHELFDNKFYIRKHYISTQKDGFNVYELLQKAIRDADRPLSRAQLQQVVPGVTPVVVGIAMDTSEILNYWGYYFHGEKTRISIQESRELESWLKGFLSDGAVHTSHEVYAGVQRMFPLVLQDNYAKDPNGCFSLLQYWFRDQFQFVRPYLAEKKVTIVKPSQLLREYIYSRDEIQIEDLSAYLKEIGLDRLSQLSLAKACDDKFFLVSNMKLVSIDRLGVDEQIAEEVESIILPHVVGTMPIRDLPCFQDLPKITVDWSDWLVYSVLRKWSKKLDVGESYNQIRLAVPLIAKAGEFDTSVVFYDSKQQESFSTDDLSKMDELLEDMIDWDDLDTE